MKNIVIAGSASLQEENKKWVQYWAAQKNYTVLDYPKSIEPERLPEKYPAVCKHFFESLKAANILFVANETKHDIPGYIGAEVFAEIMFTIVLNLTEGKNIDIILAHTPSDKIQGRDEVQLWLKLGWVRIMKA